MSAPVVWNLELIDMFYELNDNFTGLSLGDTPTWSSFHDYATKQHETKSFTKINYLYCDAKGRG